MKMSRVIICRCEEVTREEIEKAIEDGATTMNEVKRFSKAGVGLCQGRTCRRLVEKILAEKTGKSAQDILPSSYRQPVRPVKMEIMENVDSSEKD